MSIFLSTLLILIVVWSTPLQAVSDGKADKNRLPDEPLPLQTETFPKRPRLLIEFGEPFLSNGPLSRGFTLPTGQVLRPALWLFGTYRSGMQRYDSGSGNISEWANRLDLFGNLRFSATERLVVGYRPLDETGRVGYNFHPSSVTSGWQGDVSGQLRTLFFEGDIGEMLPFLDRNDIKSQDIGISVGRQDLLIQDGFLINATMDAAGLTRNTLRPSGTSNLRLTGLYAWNQLAPGVNAAQLWGLFAEVDLPVSTVNLDALYVQHGGLFPTDALYGGLSAVQRIGRFNTTFRVNASIPTGKITVAHGRGVLLASELSWTPHQNENLWYLNTFLAINQFTPAALGRTNAGQLGRIGILFAPVGMGHYGAAIDSRTQEVFGGSLGYQMFFKHTRRQLVLEIGGKQGYNNANTGSLAAGLLLQQAIGRRMILRMDGFVSARPGMDGAGFRLETLIKF